LDEVAIQDNKEGEFHRTWPRGAQSADSSRLPDSIAATRLGVGM